MSSDQRDHTGIKDEPCCPSLWWLCIKGVVPVLLIAICLGCSNGFSGAKLPALLNETFADDSYKVSGAVGAASGVVNAVVSSFAGSISDSVGRKPVLFVGCLICLISPMVYVVSGSFAAFWFTNPTMIIFPLLNMLYATVADCVINSDEFKKRNVSDRDRDKLMAVINSFVMAIYLACIGVSFPGAMMPPRVMFLCVAAGAGGAALVTFFLLPNTGGSAVQKREEEAAAAAAKTKESSPLLPSSDNDVAAAAVTPCEGTEQETADQQQLQQQQQPEREEKDQNLGSCQALARCWNLLVQNKNMRVICLIAVANTTDFTMFNSMVIIYMRNTLHVSSEELSTFLILVGACSILFALVMGILGRTNILKSVRGLMLLGLCGDFLLSLAFAVLKTQTEAKVAVVLLLAALCAQPSVSAAAALVVSREEYGVAMGVLGSARAVAQTVAPLIFGEMFSAARYSSFPGWPFLFGCGMVVIAVLLTIFGLDLPHVDDIDEAEQQQ